MDAENDVRLQKIEKHVQPKIDTTLQRGCIIQYYRKSNKDEESWKGPAKVIALDGTVGLIRHGAKVIHAHIRNIRKFRSQENEEDTWGAESTEKMMRNDEENMKASEVDQNFVKLKKELEKFHFSGGKLASHKCKK